MNPDYLLEDGSYPSYTFPGGYPLFYLAKDNTALCPDCANKVRIAILDPDWILLDSEIIVTSEINYESPDLYCDQCNRPIESAYGENNAQSN